MSLTAWLASGAYQAYLFICILYKLLIVVKRRKPKAASYGIFGSRSEPVKVIHFKGCVIKVTYIYLSTYFPHSTTTSECTAMLGILKTCIKGGAVVPKFITITRTLPRALLLLFFAKKKKVDDDGTWNCDENHRSTEWMKHEMRSSFFLVMINSGVAIRISPQLPALPPIMNIVDC